jgi:antitoxin component of MazEF toxin-antitoxin module
VLPEECRYRRGGRFDDRKQQHRRDEAEKKGRYALEQLIGEITEANRHGEISWGPPVGNEAW